MSYFEDMFDPYDPHEDDDDDEIVCKYCKEQNLHFQHTGNRWRLYDVNNKPHVCKKIASPNDFEDLSKE